jgi:hypothetical protein
MLLSNLVQKRTGICFILGCLVSRASAYFIITEPTPSTVWVNGAANLISWSKGLLDGVNTFDIEMTRLSQDGLTFVARDVPTTTGNSLNVLLQDIPAADDYFLLFINSTHGIMYSTSSRFTILNATDSSSANSSQPSPNPSAPTVTVSGSPNPTNAFATTFPPSANGVKAGWDSAWTSQLVSLACAFTACLMGAAWTVW